MIWVRRNGNLSLTIDQLFILCICSNQHKHDFHVDFANSASTCFFAQIIKYISLCFDVFHSLSSISITIMDPLQQLSHGKRLNLDLISQRLLNKLCAIRFDLEAVTKLLKLCCSALEKLDPNRIHIKTRHRLCVALTICYFSLLKHESDNFSEILSYIRISLTCMSLLKQSSVASHILCRALLERSVADGHLFNRNFDPESIGENTNYHNWGREDSIKLSKENLKVTIGSRFRRLPNHANDRSLSRTWRRQQHKQTLDESNEDNVQETTQNNKNVHNNLNHNHNHNHNHENSQKSSPDKESINSYLLIEAFKSSINNMEDFAHLFVEFHCPAMLDRLIWSNEEALRVINEKNLSILRRFEQIPPLWDLYELIGQAGCLKGCLVLVKALLAAHLALWASATNNSCQNRMIPTARLIPPLAQSGLVPKAFGLIVEVFPYLAPNEVFSVLNDIWQYLKETNLNQNWDTNLSPDDKAKRAKACLNRLRLFMCQHIPGPLYVKIFKDFYRPQVVVTPVDQ